MVRLVILLVAGLLVSSSCSINKMAMKSVADALTGDGSSEVFTSDSDPELVGDAIPFAIKMYESLLASNPKHDGLILTTGSLFVMYANAFVQGPAELLPSSAHDEREQAKLRAKKLYLRGADILYAGLEKKFPGFGEASQGESAQTGTLKPLLAKAKKQDVPLLYWTVAGTLAAYSVDNFDISLAAKIPGLTAMIHRAYELDPDYGNGTLDEFYILFYGSLPSSIGGDRAKAEEHFKRAEEKTKGLSAGPYVSYAQSLAIPAQDYETFKDNLEKALAIDPDAEPSNRLVNILAQRKARYLLDNAENYFFGIGGDGEWED